MSLLQLANSPLLYILCAVVVGYVLLLCVLYLRLALARAKEMGMDSAVIKRTIRSSLSFSIAPSLPIVIALMAMSGVMGMPYPWMRLSIIGSFQYELMTAKIGANAMGFEHLGSPGTTPQVFSNAMWIMGLGIIWGMVFSIFFMKRFAGGLEKSRGKDEARLQLIIMALYFGMLSVFVGPPAVQGGLGLLTLLGSALIYLILARVLRQHKNSALQDYLFTFSMVGGMGCAVLAGLWL